MSHSNKNSMVCSNNVTTKEIYSFNNNNRQSLMGNTLYYSVSQHEYNHTTNNYTTNNYEQPRSQASILMGNEGCGNTPYQNNRIEVNSANDTIVKMYNDHTIVKMYNDHTMSSIPVNVGYSNSSDRSDRSDRSYSGINLKDLGEANNHRIRGYYTSKSL